MKYKCKILTSEFKQRVDEFINKMYPGNTYFSELERIRTRDTLNAIWNKKLDATTEFKELLTKYQILTPQYTESVFNGVEEGYQSRARIEWEGRVRKIDQIDEIYSYKRTIS